MNCPKCNTRTYVMESRFFPDEKSTIRKHCCKKCKESFYSKEEWTDTADGKAHMSKFNKEYQSRRKK